MTLVGLSGRGDALRCDHPEEGEVDLSSPRVAGRGGVLLVRISSHIAVWACLLVPALLVLQRGWTPLGDYAGIELRSYRALSLHPPLVGMYSTAGSGLGHTVFDPGPLAFWLLAVPIHIDPAHGLIWGAALLWGLALSLAIEAMWSAGQWVGCALVAAAVVDLLWAAPSVLENLAWNAYLPLPFLFAAAAMTYLVAKGGFGLWPFAVFTGSVAAQTHLFYVLPAVGLVLVAPFVGVLTAGKPERFRWLAAGVGVGVVCWIAPLIQSVSAHSNLAALARGTGGAPTLGVGFGLRLLADGVSAAPVWLHRAPVGFYPDMGFVFSHQPAYGIVVLSAVIGATAFGALTRNRGLFATGVITAVTASALVSSFAMIPKANLVVVDYLLITVWLVGFLLWILAAWCLLALSRPVASLLTRRRVTAAGCSALVVLVAGGSSLAIAAAPDANADFGSNWRPQEATDVARVVYVVEHTTPRGDVTIALGGPPADRLAIISVGEGVGLQLLLDGWKPGIGGIDPALTTLPSKPHSAELSVTLAGDTIEITD